MKPLNQPAPIIAALAAILIATAALVFHRLGAADVCSGNEAVEAVFVQQMVEQGHLLFPVENGVQPMYKPPMFHWTATALDRIAGVRRVTAFNLRATSALYAIAGVALTMAMAGGLLGADGAILAGLTLAASYQYIGQGRFGRVDMALCFYESLALFAFVWWLGAIEAPRDKTDSGVAGRGWLYLLAIAMGLGVLSKGPVGAILPGATIVVFLVSARRWRKLVAMLEPGPLIIGAIIASSWYFACYFGGRFGFLNRQIGSENLGRFFGTLGRMTPWYYAKPLLLNSAPLSLMVPIAVAAALWPRSRDIAEKPAAPELDRTADAMRLFAIFWIVTVVFFSVAAYKRRSYLLPLWPPGAVMLSWWILGLARQRWGRAARHAYIALCCGLIVFNFIYIPRKEVRDCAGSSFQPAANEILRVVGPDEPLYTYGFKEELAPLLFYLDRNAPPFKGRLGDAPPGYIIVPADVWRAKRGDALDLEPVLISKHGERNIVLLRRGKAYAALSSAKRAQLARSR